MKFNLHSLRTQIELYKVQHDGTLPTGANNLEQLTKATDSTGAVSTTGLADATHPFGPYVQGALPANPFSGLNTVKLDTAQPARADGDGWRRRRLDLSRRDRRSLDRPCRLPRPTKLSRACRS